MLSAIIAPQSPAQSLEHSLLDAETALLANRAQEAWQKFGAITESAAATAANPGAAQRYYMLKMRIALAVARPVDAVRAEIAAEGFTANAAERTQLRTRLLAALRDAREHGVKLEAAASPDPIVAGWLELGAIATEGRASSLIGEAEAASWRARYPNHPALEVLAQALPPPLVMAATGGSIALLLPLSGPAAGQAATVRDGFLSAYYQLPAATRPALQVYDTGAVTAAAAVSQARAAGSSFIVGPLTREDVAAVADLGSQSVPVLALNFLPADRTAPRRPVPVRAVAGGGSPAGGTAHPGGWPSPRRRAGAARRLGQPRDRRFHARVDGRRRQPDHPGGVRSGRARLQLRAQGHPARRRQRRASPRLQNVLGTKLNFEPRHRGDIEYVFVVPESATNARLIEPQLKFFYAGDIPSYSLSNAFEPEATDANRDADGLMYPDMPWMVSDDASLDAIRGNIEQAWGNGVAWRSRLFAFGYDACQLMLALSGGRQKLAEVQIAGLSGQLHFDAQGRVQRELIWVQLRDGEPKRLPASPAESP